MNKSKLLIFLSDTDFWTLREKLEGYPYHSLIVKEYQKLSGDDSEMFEKFPGDYVQAVKNFVNNTYNECNSLSDPAMDKIRELVSRVSN